MAPGCHSERSEESAFLSAVATAYFIMPVGLFLCGAVWDDCRLRLTMSSSSAGEPALPALSGLSRA